MSRCAYEDFLAATASYAQRYASVAATLPTAPTLNVILASRLTGAITTVPFVTGGLVDIAGAIILPPGAYCAFYTSTVSGTAAGAFSFSWEEIAV